MHIGVYINNILNTVYPMVGGCTISNDFGVAFFSANITVVDESWDMCSVEHIAY